MQEDAMVPVLEESVVAGLRTGLRGGLIQPGDEGYDEGRRVWTV